MKKILIKWFPKYFNVCNHTYIDLKTLGDPGKILHVYNVEDSKASLAEALGIDEKRGTELQKISIDAWRNTSSISTALEIASKELKHANELVLISIILYSINEKLNGGLPPGLQALLMKLGK